MSFYDLLESKRLARSFGRGQLRELLRAAQNVTLHQPPSATDAYRFFWRGQRNVAWPLSSRLYRDFGSGRPGRADMEKREAEILQAFAATGLEESQYPVLEQLAILQHHGAPTRLIDVSTDYLPALYFACDDAANGRKPRDDGVLVAFLVDAAAGELTTGTHATIDEIRAAADSDARYYIPRPFSGRIRAQRGAFIVSREPGTYNRGQMTIKWPLPPRPWTENTLNQVLNDPGVRQRGRPGHPVVLGLGIDKDLKAEVLDYLSRAFRLTPTTMFPDLEGFVLSIRH